MIDCKVEQIQGEVLVIGGGLAGIFAAVTASEQGRKVVLVDKGTVGASGQTPWGTGLNYYEEGVSASREQWHELMAKKSERLYNPAFLDQFMDYSKEVFDTMERWGALGKIRPVPIFAGVLKEAGVQVYNRTMITKLIKEDNRVVGAAGFSLDDEDKTMRLFSCKGVINCAGAGGYKSPGFPIQGLTFDGDAISYRVGAEISGKEFNDLHTTESPHPGSFWYGNGSIWGPGYHKASFSIESNIEMPFTMDFVFQAERGALPVTMGPPKGKPPIDGKPPAGGSPSKEPSAPPKQPYVKEAIPKNSPLRSVDIKMNGGTPPPSYLLGGATAGMSVHKGEGIFPNSDTGSCRSTVAGLYGAGDALCSMLSGASYRVVGMALVGSGVQGIAAGKECARDIVDTPWSDMDTWDIDTIAKELFEPLNRDHGYDPRWVTQLLQSLMTPYYILYYKSQSRLESALVQLQYIKNHLVPQIRAEDIHTLKLTHETANMVLNAEMKLRASLYRTESRGTHFREDFPQEQDDTWLAWVVLSQDDKGDMTVRKHDIPKREGGGLCGC